MAEIEHYVDPKDKRHPRYAEAKDIVLNLLPKEVQEGGETTLTQMSIGDAVGKVSRSVVALANLAVSRLMSPAY